MTFFLMLGLAILACWCVNLAVKSIMNLIELRKIRKNPDSLYMHRNGLVYNPKTEKLEKDNSPFLPFE